MKTHPLRSIHDPPTDRSTPDANTRPPASAAFMSGVTPTSRARRRIGGWPARSVTLAALLLSLAACDDETSVSPDAGDAAVAVDAAPADADAAPLL